MGLFVFLNMDQTGCFRFFFLFNILLFFFSGLVFYLVLVEIGLSFLVAREGRCVVRFDLVGSV